MIKNAMQLKGLVKNIAKEKNIPPQIVLQNYMLERVLERISLSIYKTKFILKGGLLISSLIGLASRTTMDIDATVKNYAMNEDNIKTAFMEILHISLNDGVSFNLKKIETIRKEDKYDGFRVSLEAQFDTLTVPLKIDLTAGDKITPDAISHQYQLLLEQRSIEILSYNVETILAEKIETVISRGVLNTRLRDYYDIYVLNKLASPKIDYSIYVEAITATSKKRGTTKELKNSDLVVETIKNSSVMQKRWKDYQRDYNYAKGISFDDVILEIKKLVSLLSK